MPTRGLDPRRRTDRPFHHRYPDVLRRDGGRPHRALEIDLRGGAALSGDVRFILGGSGHIAGVINPPEANKYDYRVTDSLPDDPDLWAASAENSCSFM